MGHTSETSEHTASHNVVDVELLLKGMAALRIFFGLVWLSNGLAKLFSFQTFDLGFFNATLITRESAQNIATGAAKETQFTALGSFYQNVVLPHWGFFGIFLTLAELAVGIGLVFGIATRLAAVGGMMLIGPIWLLMWHNGVYLWEYPLDLAPLLLLAVVPTGRTWGADRVLATRFHRRWPF